MIMLKTEKLTINGKAYVRTWSDDGKMLERDSVLYEEAIDPAELGRFYTESDQDVPDEPADEADYMAAQERFGVK